MNLRQLFLQHNAQTSAAPLAIEITKAEGCVFYGADGREYIDLIGGISVANTGHRHPAVVEAIKQQADQYLHVMVYGEVVQSPQVRYAHRLVQHLPPTLNSVYFTNSGAEAIEGAMKLCKRATGRTGIAGFQNSYHGSTQGALSLIGDERWRRAYRPLLPDVHHLRYNHFEDLQQINCNTACVVAETVQAESGVQVPQKEWLQALRKRCTNVGALLVLDEIQAGFGRTGTLWAFEQFGVVPDVLCLGKALGGGLPLGAFIANQKLMQHLTENPVLGHITTFGGHPLCCAGGSAAFNALLQENMMDGIDAKETLFKQRLHHSAIKHVSGCGLWLAVDFGSFQKCKAVIDYCLDKGVFTDWFLFAPHCLRISPPLAITESQINRACDVILQACAAVE